VSGRAGAADVADGTDGIEEDAVGTGEGGGGMKNRERKL